MALTVRGKNQRFLSTHRGIYEIPAGSNYDDRPNSKDKRSGIKWAQLKLAPWLARTAWCGTWAAAGWVHAGVRGVNYRQASVALIAADAKAHKAPFIDWKTPSQYKQVLRGDAVCWFGLEHVETVRGFKKIDGAVYVITDGGNTSATTAGSQSDGGTTARHVRPLSQADGFARVNYPGGVKIASRLVARVVAIATRVRHSLTRSDVAAGIPAHTIQSDTLLLEQLEANTDPAALAMAAEIKAARAA